MPSWTQSSKGTTLLFEVFVAPMSFIAAACHLKGRFSGKVGRVRKQTAPEADLAVPGLEIC